jgi:hypothetical protein
MVKRGLILAFLLSFFCIEILKASNVSYNYDSLNRLVEVLYENTGKIVYTYDATGNILSQQVTRFITLKGDVNGDSKVDLADAILCLQVVSGLAPNNIFPNADVNEDGKIGLAEAIYAMQKVAGL